MEQDICPGCGRHCDLTNPHCKRGAEYLRGGAASQSPRALKAPAPMRRDLGTNDRLIDALRDLSRIMRAQYEGRAIQKRILMILNQTESITQRNLTDRLDIQPGSASEILAKLENGGLSVRTPNAKDRRTTDIHLTGPGRALAEEAAGQRRQRHEEMFFGLLEAEKESLLSLLEKLREIGRRGTAGPARLTGPWSITWASRTSGIPP